MARRSAPKTPVAIQFTPEALCLPLDVARACMVFASEDMTRPHLTGIGVDQGFVCATDGHTAVRFLAPGDDSRTDYHGRHWSGPTVVGQIAAARAAKLESVTLPWSACIPAPSRYPPVHAVTPRPRVKAGAPVGVDARYLGRLETVVKACGRGISRVDLVSLGDPLDPLRFDVKGPVAEAHVTIMPMRI